MKRTWKYLLMAALVVGLGMNVTSCKDDNDDNNNERTPEEIAQDPYEKESEAADALYRLVSQLSVCDSLPNDWKTATFEPKAGKVLDQSQPRVRTIAVNNAAEAVARYNSLTGKELPATTTSDTYKVEGVGTLTLNVGGAGTIATIDVDVKQMPQLAQLRLVSVADMGENGHFKGEPYYSFGDVVMDKDSCYWICVRPAYSPNGKEDTHWMSFQLIDKNTKTYTKKGCQQQVYPVDLGVQKEKMQYLAQLLAILANPDGYKTEAGLMGEYFNGTGLGGLQPAAMPVDSLARQAALWDDNNIWEKIMPVGYKSNEALLFQRRFLKDVTFIYEKGSASGTDLTIKTVQYKNAGNFYKEEPTYEKVKVDMKTIAFDVTNSYSTKGKRTNANCPVPDAFVVRYKNGYQLSSNLIFSPSATDSIPGVKTIHRFNACKDTQPIDKTSYPKMLAEPRMLMAKDGKFYKSNAACKANNTEAVALVVYVGDKVEISGKYSGLAMSFAKRSKMQWDEEDDVYRICGKATFLDISVWETLNDGFHATNELIKDNHQHLAAMAADQFSVNGFQPIGYDFSTWFLPSAGQVMLAIKGLGGTVQFDAEEKYYDCNFGTKQGKDLKTQLEEAGIKNFDVNFDCWTSTEYNHKNAVRVQCVDGNKVEFSTASKNDQYDVRPFIAF